MLLLQQTGVVLLLTPPYSREIYGQHIYFNSNLSAKSGKQRKFIDEHEKQKTFTTLWSVRETKSKVPSCYNVIVIIFYFVMVIVVILIIIFIMILIIVII